MSTEVETGMTVGRAFLTVIAMAFIAGCTPSGPLPVPPRPTATMTSSPVVTVTGPDVLQDDAAGGNISYQVPVKATERIADDTTVVKNVDLRPLTITGIEPIFQGQPPANTVVG